MFRKYNAKDYHRKLIKDMQQVNFAVDSGVCFGYSVMAMQAILLRDTASFDRRMEVLFHLPQEELAAQMQAAFKPVSASDTISAKSRQKFYIDMYAFLSGVSVYQNPRSYGHLFDVDVVDIRQDISRAASVVMPKKLIDQGGLAEAGRFYGVYTDHELKKSLQSLYQAFIDSKIDYPVTFIVNSSNHALTVGFDAQYQHWLYMEIHDGVTQFTDSDSLAKKIHEAFSENEYTAITAVAYVAGAHANEVAEILNKWQLDDSYRAAHDLSMRRIQSSDSMQTNLLYMAINNNDVRRLKTILQSSHVKVNQRASNGLSPLHLACIRSYTECIKLLLAHPEIDVNQPTIVDGQTPLHISFLQYHHEDMLALLQHKKIDINARREDSLTVLHLAAYTGRLDDLKEFLRRGADVNQTTDNGMTALHYAVQENQLECVKFLLEQPGIDIDKSTKKGTTALMIAAAMNHLDIAKEILIVSPHSAGKDVDGMNAYDVARYNNEAQMINLLGWFVQSYAPANPAP